MIFIKPPSRALVSGTFGSAACAAHIYDSAKRSNEVLAKPVELLKAPAARLAATAAPVPLGYVLTIV